LRDVADRVVEVEYGESPTPKDIERRIPDSLHQTCLPKLDPHDSVYYDQGRRLITLDSGARRVDL